MDFQKMFLGIKPKKALGILKKGLPPLKLAQADKNYKRKNIAYEEKCDDYSCSYEIKHLFATKYHNTFSARAYFSRDRRILKEKKGKVTKYGPWYYWGSVSVCFHALPMKNYTQTQAKLKELYPKFTFYFYKDCVEVTIGRSINNLKEMEQLMKDFGAIYAKESVTLVDNMNYAHDQIHKN